MPFAGNVLPQQTITGFKNSDLSGARAHFDRSG